jgi:hypothetical protein
MANVESRHAAAPAMVLAARAAIDIPLALALIGFGLVIVIEPSLIPGLMPPAM